MNTYYKIFLTQHVHENYIYSMYTHTYTGIKNIFI